MVAEIHRSTQALAQANRQKSCIHLLRCNLVVRKRSYLLVVTPTPMLAAVPGVLEPISPILPLIKAASLYLLLLPPVILCVPVIHPLPLGRSNPVTEAYTRSGHAGIRGRTPCYTCPVRSSSTCPQRMAKRQYKAVKLQCPFLLHTFCIQATTRTRSRPSVK